MSYLPHPAENRLTNVYVEIVNELCSVKSATPDLEDAIQTAFEKFYKHYGTDSLERFPGATLKNCLLRMVYNEMVNLQRRKKTRRERVSLEDHLLNHPCCKDAAAEAAMLEIARNISDLLKAKDPKLALAAEMLYDGKSYREINELLGFECCDKTIANRLKSFKELVIKNQGRPLEN